MMTDLSPEFIQTIQNTFDADGKAWLTGLPDLIAETSHCWNLTDITPVLKLSYNFVAYANRDGKSLVLKIGIPRDELISEIAALRLYTGRGACRLLDADIEKGTMLLERLQPGRMLSTLKDDEQATHIAAEVMSQLWRPAPENQFNFIQLKKWFAGFKRLRRRYNGKTGPMPENLVEIAETLSQELLVENKDEALLHGDFHHFNVLESERGWLAIDPKGVIGPKGYEVGPLLINPNDRFLSGSNPQAQTEKRIAILSEMLGMERERIRSWGICHAVLSAWWSIEDNDPGGGEYSLRCAEIFMTLKQR